MAKSGDRLGGRKSDRRGAGVSQTYNSGARQVLKAIREGSHTWEELRRATTLSEDRLGLALITLFNSRQIRTKTENGERLYYPVFRAPA